MSPRHALYVLLAAVSLAAAVLSFAALRDLALLCGFSTRLAWLLPVVVDAGAAAGSLVWLGGHGDIRAQRFACRLALVLLASSVAANAVSHGLEAYGLRPAWWVVVIVSAVAPGVLGAVVHLAVLVGRSVGAPPVSTSPPAGVETVAAEVETPAPGPVFFAVDEVAEMTRVMASSQFTTISTPPSAPAPVPVIEVEETWDTKRERLLGEGAGRKRLSKELEVSEWEARRMQEKWEARVEGQAEDQEEAVG